MKRKIFNLLFALVLALSFSLVAAVPMATPALATGSVETRSPGIMADDATVGTVAWTNPDNAKAEDENFAEFSSTSPATTHYLKATDFGFSIPAGATINGILVEVKKFSQFGYADVKDNAVRIVKGENIGSTDKSLSTWWPGSLQYFSYGGSSDLWSETWTAEDINSSTFGFAISAEDFNGEGNPFDIDHIRITVDYTPLIIASTLYEHKNTGEDGAWVIPSGGVWKAQTFTPSIAHKITSVKLLLQRAGLPGTVTVVIRATDVDGHPTGDDLCSGTIDGNTLPPWGGSSEWREITFGAGYNLVADTKYAIEVRAPSGDDDNCVLWYAGAEGTYTGGCIESGAEDVWESSLENDFMFEEWGVAPTEVWVDIAWVGSSFGDSVGGHIFGIDAFAAIQDAVNAVAEGGTVNVAAGTYNEVVAVSKSVNLLGANAGVRAGVNPGTRGAESIVDAFDISVNDVVINGFQINGAVFVGEGQVAIYIRVSTSGHTISNNVLPGPGGTPPSAGRGILFGFTVSNTTVSCNEIYGWQSGIYINPSNPSSNLLFQYNSIHDNWAGIGSDGLNDVSILNNNFSHNVEGFGSSTVGTNVGVHFNNFTGNGAGVNWYPGTGNNIDAKNNWWGANSGPTHAANPGGTGDAASDSVDYAPWTGASVENSKTETTVSGDQTVDAIDEAGTEVDKSGTGTPTITIARYTTNPGGSAPAGFNAAGSYIDVHADGVTDIDGIQIRHYYTDAEISGLIESTLRMYYQSGTGWVQCSDTGVNTTDIPGPPAYSGYIWANLTATSTPGLDYLLGSTFCGIGQAIGAGGGGGGGGVIPTTKSLLRVDMLGKISTVEVTNNGVIVESGMVVSLKNGLTLELDKGTKLVSSDKKVPTRLVLTVTNEPLLPPEGMVIISQIYDCVAYTDGGASKSVNFNPAATLEINYNPETVPENAVAVFIAYYDAELGWVPLDAPSGFVAGAGTAAAQVRHFTPFAVLAKLPPTSPANFEVRNLDISPGQVGIGENVIISAQVDNTGGMSGEYTLIMNMGGLPEASQVVEVASGQSQEVSFTVTPDASGSYQVEIGGLQGSFVVVALSPTGFKWLTPWSISVMATVVLAALALTIARKRRQPAVVVGESLETIPPAAKELREPAPVPSRFVKAMAAIVASAGTLVRKRPQPTTKAEETVLAMVKETSMIKETSIEEYLAEESSELTPTVVTVNASVSGGRGSANPVSQTVNSGTSATITFTPRKGYHIAGITDNGKAVSITNPYVISEVTADRTVVVTFATDTFTITASAGSGGSISPSGAVTVNSGAKQAFTIAPNTGYHIVDVLVDSSPVGAVTSYPFADLIADHTISASFAIDTFTINAAVSGGHGLADPAAQMVNSGASAAITITPDTGYHIAGITDNGKAVSITNPYVISEVTADRTVVVTFAINTFTINAAVSGDYGSVSPVTQMVNSGKSAVIIITPDTGYHIAGITDNGKAVSITNPYVISEVTADHTVVATFAADAFEKPSEPTPAVVEEPREAAAAPSLSPVRDLKIIPNRVKPGGIVNIFAEVTNNDPTTTTFSLVLKVRDIVEAVKEITLGPGQSQKVAFIVLRDKPGVYDVDLEGLAGSFTVES